jgi:hypothetical protein
MRYLQHSMSMSMSKGERSTGGGRRLHGLIRGGTITNNNSTYEIVKKHLPNFARYFKFDQVKDDMMVYQDGRFYNQSHVVISPNSGKQYDFEGMITFDLKNSRTFICSIAIDLENGKDFETNTWKDYPEVLKTNLEDMLQPEEKKEINLAGFYNEYVLINECSLLYLNKYYNNDVPRTAYNNLQFVIRNMYNRYFYSFDHHMFRLQVDWNLKYGPKISKNEKDIQEGMWRNKIKARNLFLNSYYPKPKHNSIYAINDQWNVQMLDKAVANKLKFTY